MLSLNSCFLSDEDVISTEDLLLGKWKISTYKENGTTPDTFNSCDLSTTIEFTTTEMLTDEFINENDTNNCILNNSYSYSYFVENNEIKANDIVIKIINLTTTTLELAVIENNITINKTYEKLN